ncbi:sodium/solute symporter family protein [Desulforapulum autotrophicum HRM2]|uniref:Sodium/solute symporter family protein n=1 Tax=Desulforapulum autotrophicum (strain ATCC 43914 / DSM 3382 / VKM B-1955 / HRM2) TaxID=177437 RepID=C0QA91_DESAH|nr:sodium:solute symporter family protein [Desulforapulum autotrophicum]ACN14676.1 sodium/solute symporter family protein [Desulforapulum autotrophicum HRM2]
MNPYQLFLCLLFAYTALLISVGWYFNKRQQTQTDFFLAGKNAGMLSIGCSAAASWLTAGGILAVIGFFMLLGMGSVWGFVAPNIIALFAIGLFVRKIKGLPAITQPELLELRYGSYLRLPVAIIITVVMILFAVADIKGFAMVLSTFYGVSPLMSALIVALAVSIYVTMGGLSAVIATDIIQFLCLTLFVLIMAGVVMTSAGTLTAEPVAALLTSVPDNWWNPGSIGLPMILIFSIAIIPGWITEQDQWQKVWAATDERSARNGMFLGSVLVTVVFAGCAFLALGLNTIYPEIAGAGFPMGMARAEPALLTFIMDHNFSGFILALSAVGLATAAMSCTDTFATSGASCISRDIFQRYLHPGATMKQMLVVNRISVVIIIVFATLGSFFIGSIIDAIHIATFIASASYFFALMGGLYWRRATGQGAVASMVTGFIIQSGLVILDLAKTPPMAPPFLETIHPILMGHGVILSMAVSGLVFVGVSLSTAPTSRVRLALFFKNEAEKLTTAMATPATAMAAPEILDLIQERPRGNRTTLHLSCDILGTLEWKNFVDNLQGSREHWVSASGRESIRRITHPDILSCVSVSRGATNATLWLEAEAETNSLERVKQDMAHAYTEILTVVKG